VPVKVFGHIGPHSSNKELTKTLRSYDARLVLGLLFSLLKLKHIYNNPQTHGGVMNSPISHTRRFNLRLVISLLAVFLLVPAAYAQFDTAAVLGTVTTPTARRSRARPSR
jgi:hypothetical protein